ncbi:MAG: hypothetical protein U0Y08_10230 [Bacteroidia bacterium]
MNCKSWKLTDRFGSNGKENNDEVKGNWQDYGMRMYDTRLGSVTFP